MTATPAQALLLASMLFALGLLGVLVRRNLLFMLMSIEIMLNAAALAFVAAGMRWHAADGQVMFMMILALAAAEAAVGLAILLRLHAAGRPTLDADTGNRLKG
ncbi:NADH-quinone oxidoreductase subunit NuoK [Gluconacetobacter azotocaptans]|uniref:NADH-quinone oxidoreductase subunit K n=1 Tax=Gluconacetobacter azotocaptans TaxID=142834 RepID=A0A7W4JQ95_9PROT|nr:NADH-quinone oxidoreductase subunit NuoK [Gluconacetobacter azotocaptans]MBB2188898.1 NADH-quinone oxidoreductase subunit NuoK [Gluconacetobacter azotocaptans]MBM9401667.1 NADH-quinone oxidoreductase subunit NuoK [Gluconacetobacter azotocaptans]GBQ31013.1 NADH-quinone oxidoreductase subunit K [Gluconacetobacter azotocaptans DSM 13594]